MLLKRRHPFRIMCAANVVNIIVLLVSRTTVVSLPAFLMRLGLGGKSEFSATSRRHECGLNYFFQNPLKGVTASLSNVLVSI